MKRVIAAVLFVCVLLSACSAGQTAATPAPTQYRISAEDITSFSFSNNNIEYYISYSINLTDLTAHIKKSDYYTSQEVETKATWNKEKWDSFTSLILNCDVSNWKLDYDEHATDGDVWEVSISGGFGTKSIRGNNLYPDNYYEFLKIVKDYFRTEETAAIPEETESYYGGDIPAFVQAGLPSRNKMADVDECYYYREDTDFSPYNTKFNNYMEADLDGDGQDEVVSVTEGAVTCVEINGIRLSLKSAYLESYVLDIDKTDGKKELCISTQGGLRDYIITYENGQPNIIFTDYLHWFNHFASGSGCIETWEFDDVLGYYYFKLWKLKDDRSGFEPINVLYFTNHLQSYWDSNGNWNIEYAADTSCDQYLAEKPGGKESEFVPKGTKVYIGLYDMENGCVMILDTKGNLLGWLNQKECDVNEYTDWKFFSEGE